MEQDDEDEETRLYKSILERYKSKKDLHHVMTDILVSISSHLRVIMQQLFLPKLQFVKLSYLHGILRDEVRVFMNNEVRRISVPMWPELSVAKVMPLAKLIPGFFDYVPPEWEQLLKVDRDFFWAIMVTLDPQFVMELINDVREQRFQRKKEAEAQQPREIGISLHWLQRLNAAPFKSCKYLISL